MKASFFLGLLAILALGAGSASAHHSFAMYEREKVVTLNGTVKTFTWVSPHVSIAVLVETAKGKRTWEIEGNSPIVLARGGWTPMVMKPGDHISLGIHPRKDGMGGGLLADEVQILVNGQAPKGVLSLVELPDETAAN